MARRILLDLREKIYLATIHCAQHIINNLLNQLILVQFKAHSGEPFDAETLQLFDEILIEANRLMKELAAVDQIDEERIMQTINSISLFDPDAGIDQAELPSFSEEAREYPR